MKKTILLTLPTLLLVSCGQEDVVTYQAPKEPHAAPAMQMPQGHPAVGSPASMSAPASAPSVDFKAELPEGWTEKPGSGMRRASYSIEGTSIDFYLIALSMGDVPSNVNRWRGQVGLDPATPEEITGAVETFSIDGRPTTYAEIYNPETDKGIIAAIIDLSPSYWYFTAKGSVAELKDKESEIRGFLQSITF